MESINKHHYAVIMAGGTGTRLWPISRENAPKQFKAFLDNNPQTLLQIMYELLRGAFAADHIFVQTGEKFKHFVEKQIPELPKNNILIELEMRDTAPALGFATAVVMERDPEARIGVFYSDHLVRNKKNFLKAINISRCAVEDFPDHIIIIGVKPSYPHTGLGYIKINRTAQIYEEEEIFYADHFIEKPDYLTAESLLKSWQYLWNTGYKFYHAKTFFTFLEKIDKDMFKVLKKIMSLVDREEKKEEMRSLYATLRRISFEYLITEKFPNILVVPSDLGWADIGDWASLYNILAEINDHHMITKGSHLGIDSEHCLIYGQERMIVTLGLKDTIVIDTDDVLLIADKQRAQDIKTLVEKLKSENKHKYL